MKQFNEFLSSFPDYFGIFLLMLSTFLIGYFAAFVFQKAKYQKLLKKMQRKSNAKKVSQSVSDIETIFTEIKPKIVEVVKETTKQQQAKVELPESAEGIAKSPEKIIEETRTSYINYTKSKPVLNFENFGYGSEAHKDDLTKINGIGPYIEQRLNEIGIFNYKQISNFKDEDITVLTELIDFFPDRIERDSWVAQAKALEN